MSMRGRRIAVILWWLILAGDSSHRHNTAAAFVPVGPSLLFRHRLFFDDNKAVKLQASIEKERETFREKNGASNGQHEHDSPDYHRHRRILKGFANLPRTAVRTYASYATRLWNETNEEARTKVAHNQAATAIRQVQHLLRNNDNEYIATSLSENERSQLLAACAGLLQAIGNHNNQADKVMAVAATAASATNSATKSPSKQMSASSESLRAAISHPQDARDIVAQAAEEVITKSLSSSSDQSENSNVNTGSTKRPRSVLFGSLMGLVTAGWVFSGNFVFTLLFTLITVLGQLEYYRMVQSTGVYPARRISVLGSCLMFVTALFAPSLHQLCLPLCGIWAMIWFLTMKRTMTTIPEIATTFTGLFYLGYVPSFWVRIRLLDPTREPLTRLAPLAKPVLDFVSRTSQENLPDVVHRAIHVPITTGAVFIFWTWLGLAFSDVGAYFVGRQYGRTKLGRLCPAAGMTSPNKTVEGVIGGCVVSGALGMLGAWVQKWPWWAYTGAAHGILLGLLGLIGDLTASMLKRDAGLKDFGDLIPEHGGILDRVDSFIWTAPYSYLVISAVIPALKSIAGPMP